MTMNGSVLTRRLLFHQILIFLQNPSKVLRAECYISVQPNRYRKTIQSQLQDLKGLQMINHKTRRVGQDSAAQVVPPKSRKDKQVEILMGET